MKHVSAIALGVFWIWMGLLHFVAYDEVVREMPAYFPWKGFWVVVTGIAELVFAVGIFVPRTRRIGALGTIVLLVLYTPAVLHMIANDVFPEHWSSGAHTAARWLLAPINISLALWAYLTSAAAARSPGYGRS